MKRTDYNNRMSKYCSGCLPGEVHHGLFMPPGKYLKSI